MDIYTRKLTYLWDADVIVVGSGSAGATAAIAAARNGARTVLIERFGFLGGTSTQVLDTFYGFYTPGTTAYKVVGGIPDDVVAAARALFDLPEPQGQEDALPQQICQSASGGALDGESPEDEPEVAVGPGRGAEQLPREQQGEGALPVRRPAVERRPGDQAGAVPQQRLEAETWRPGATSRERDRRREPRAAVPRNPRGPGPASP